MSSNNDNCLEEEFKGYFDYSDEEYKRIWKESIIVLDTNIILNFYRYSIDTRNDIFSMLSSISKRLWIPYWVVKEYLKNRYTVVTENDADYDKLVSKVTKNIDDCLNEIHLKKSDNLNCKKEVETILENAKKNAVNILKNEKKSKKDGINNPKNGNVIDKQILKLFNNSYGNDFSEEDYKDIKEEGIRRKDNCIPPGYAGKDKNKEENGDYYIFYSMIQESKATKKDVIFITDDVKEDWFNYCDGEKNGGRCELLNEFYKKAGKLLLIYSMDGFVSAYSKNIKKQKYSESTMKELQHVSRIYQQKDLNNITDNPYYHFSIVRDYKNYGIIKNFLYYLDCYKKMSATNDILERYILAKKFLIKLENDKEIQKLSDIDGDLNFLINSFREKIDEYDFTKNTKNNLMIDVLANQIIDFLKHQQIKLNIEE